MNTIPGDFLVILAALALVTIDQWLSRRKKAREVQASRKAELIRSADWHIAQGRAAYEVHGHE